MLRVHGRAIVTDLHALIHSAKLATPLVLVGHSLGGFNMIEFRREDDIVVHPLPLSRARLLELESSLMMFYTGLERRAEDVVKAAKASSMIGSWPKK